MRIRLMLLLLLLTGHAWAQFVEASFPAPSNNISGLGFNGTVWAIDSVDCCVYGVDMWTGALQSTVILPEFDNPPVGLGVSPDAFWFAENGTAIIHSVDFNGNLLSTMDFTDSGVQHISGVDYFQWYPSYPYLWLIDSADRSIYTVSLAIGPQSLNKEFTIEEEITVHDIGWELWGIPVACDDDLSPVRFYESESSYEPLGMGNYESAVGVTTTLDNRIYFSDPEMGMIHRYSLSMGGTVEGSSAAVQSDIVYSLNNPVLGEAEMLLMVEEAQLVQIRVYSLSGRLIKDYGESMFSEGTSTLPLGSFSSGLYFINLTYESGTLSGVFTVL